MRALIVSVFLLGTVYVAQAEDAKEMAAMGWGTITCAVFANMYRGDPKFAEQNLFTWAQGFMSGLNLAALRQTGVSMNLGSMTTEEQEASIRGYCNEHPLADYIDAVLNVYGGLSPSKPARRQ